MAEKELKEGDVLSLTAHGAIPSTAWTLTGPGGELIAESGRLATPPEDDGT